MAREQCPKCADFQGEADFDPDAGEFYTCRACGHQWHYASRAGAELIAAERQRQIGKEGWTPEHDDEHTGGELAQAAACYAWPPPRPIDIKRAWPWDLQWWKPELMQGGELVTAGEARESRIRTLVKAGALIAAEIDRLQRIAKSEGQQP